jgi:hypothetical protein
MGLAFLIIFVAVLVMALIFLIIYLYQYLKTLLNFIILTIAAPFVGLLAVIPGKQGVISMYFKKLLVNMLVWPVMTILFMVGLGMLFLTTVQPGSVAQWGGSMVLNVLIFPFFKIAMCFTFWTYALKVRGVIENAFGASGSLFSFGEEKRR